MNARRFQELPFDRMSESDVREDILVPLLHHLGYRLGSQYDIRRELSLRYPHQSLGRKKPDRDPVLKGRADYVLVVNAQLSWILEAKPPVAEIDSDAIGQAWTYACHPEVRAAYFAICNGRELQVFDSLRTAESPPILTVRYEDFETRFAELQHTLGPEAIEREIACRDSARGVPLGPGLGSVAQIASGLIRYHLRDAAGVVNPNLQTIVLGGTVERDDDGRLVVFIETAAPLPGMQEINERIGWRGLDLVASATAIPTDGGEPLQLTGAAAFTIPAGEVVTMPGAGKVTLPMDFACAMDVVASGALQGNRFRGDWKTKVRVKGIPAPFAISGEFFVRLI